MLILGYLAVGGVVGVLAGLLGIGGGGVIVPVLLWLFAVQGIAPSVRVHLAIGTSLATIIFTAVAAIRAQHRRGAIDWPIARTMAGAALLGSLASGYLAGWVEAGILKQMFAVFLFLVGLQLLLHWRPVPRGRLPGRAGLFFVGLLIGAVSALVGIGGGSLTVPFLSACNVEMKRAVAISTTLGLPIALFGTLGFVLSGWHVAGRPPWSLGYVYAPALLGIALASVVVAPLGVAWSHRVPVGVLKRGFGLLLVTVAFQVWHGT